MRIIIAVASLACMGSILGIYFIHDDQSQRRKNEKGLYAEARMRIERLEEGGYTCCERRNCVCQNAPDAAMPCYRAIAEQVAGACYLGYRCCREECSQCAYYDQTTKRMTSRPCRCRCVESVEREQCTSFCGTCYRPVIHVEYIDEARSDMLSKCEEDELAEDCWASVGHAGRDQISCVMNDHGCVQKHFEGFIPGTVHAGWYRIDDPWDVYVSRSPDAYKTSWEAITGYVLLGITLAGSACALVTTLVLDGLNYRKQKMRQDISAPGFVNK